MLNAVIFDMDGVIVDSHPVHKRAWRSFLESLGKKVGDSDLDFIMDGRKREEILRHFLGELSDEEVRVLGQKKDQLFRKEAATITVIGGLREFLTQLADTGIALAVGSSGSDARVKFVLELLGLRNYFRAIITGDHVSAGKPNPAIFQMAAEQLRVSPSETLVFEDSVSGVIAAVAAGMKCIGIADNGVIPALLDAGAATTVPNYASLSVADVQRLVH